MSKPEMQKSGRVNSVDLLRGIVMALMVLDHTRYFFHASALTQNPEDISTTTPWLFFTRWVTHFCAPVFIFLMGTSAYLYEHAGNRNKKDLFWFLISRGLLMIALELTVFRLAWDFDVTRNVVDLLVIWTLGITMLFLAAFIHVPEKILIVTGLVIVFGHNLLDGIHFPSGTFADAVWKILHVKGTFPITSTIEVFVLFPALPYFGLALLGYCLGRIYHNDFDPTMRRKLLLWLGVGCCLLFLLLRFINIYGEPEPWKLQDTWVNTLLSFFKTTKYPTSLLYLLMTVGPSLVFLSQTESWKGFLSSIFIEMGRVPMFFYLLHLFIIHGAAVLLGGPNTFHLTAVWIATLAINALLWLLCRWYGNYKSTHPQSHWLKYM